MPRVVPIVLAVSILAATHARAEPVAAPGASASSIRELNRQTVQAFRSRDFAAAGVTARQAGDLILGTEKGVDAGIAAANLAASLTMEGKFDEAATRQAQADSVFERSGNRKLRGRLGVARAVTAFLAERKYSAAEPDEAVAILDGVGELLDAEDVRLACVRAQILCSSNQGARVQAGYAQYAELRRARLASGDSTGVALVSLRMGRTEGLTGGHLSALKFFTEALELLRVREDSCGMALALRNIGLAHRKVMHYPESEAAFKQALGLAEAQADRKGVAVVSNDLSLLYAEIGDNDRARVWDLKASEAMRAIVDDLNQGRLADSVLFDFFQLVKMRYANIQPYTADMFTGFYDQLVLERSDCSDGPRPEEHHHRGHRDHGGNQREPGDR